MYAGLWVLRESRFNIAKNNDLINRYKILNQTINNITPTVYAGIALTLHRKCGWGYKRINDLFSESQSLWEECNRIGIDMISMCENETGIELRSK